ncbi:zeta toxin family protein [Acidovorax sp. SUPP1855]|uniref:zeta toxin family protein n=1 Tax=Acidovorax sp. SUPP1855 TaxID=431774 RepID=UPI0024E1311B|nr:zeta toxin family protein [Acidovorax sp. SUPP1855]
MLADVLRNALDTERKPLALVLAGHNGSGKSTLWYERLADDLRVPLINADRLITSILPSDLPDWAQKLRDSDHRWQRLSQEGIRAFKAIVMAERMPFAFETVFSHWVERPDGTVESKHEDILEMQRSGYYVVLLFVGLANAALSELRVETRKDQGGHAVPAAKLRDRFPRTQAAIRHAAPLADMTLMFDNSRGSEHAFTLVRVQEGDHVLFDIRDPDYAREGDQFPALANYWMANVAGEWPMGADNAA